MRRICQILPNRLNLTTICHLGRKKTFLMSMKILGTYIRIKRIAIRRGAVTKSLSVKKWTNGETGFLCLSRLGWGSKKFPKTTGNQSNNSSTKNFAVVFLEDVQKRLTLWLACKMNIWYSWTRTRQKLQFLPKTSWCNIWSFTKRMPKRSTLEKLTPQWPSRTIYANIMTSRNFRSTWRWWKAILATIGFSVSWTQNLTTWKCLVEVVLGGF